MKVIIAGGRWYDDYKFLKEKCDTILSNLSEVEIVSGAAKGADGLGEKYAKENNYKCTKFPADWEKYGRSAGPRRNRQMAEYADGLIAFWDGKSRGTKNMIELAKKHKLKTRVILIESYGKKYVEGVGILPKIL